MTDILALFTNVNFEMTYPKLRSSLRWKHNYVFYQRK